MYAPGETGTLAAAPPADGTGMYVPGQTGTAAVGDALGGAAVVGFAYDFYVGKSIEYPAETRPDYVVVVGEDDSNG